MNVRFRAAPRRRRPAFTMAEMLIVIGIITLLAAILVPTVTTVRKAARRTASQARLSSIAAACQHYYNDFKAYPGPLRNDQLAGAKPITTPFILQRNGRQRFMVDGPDVPVKEITQTENLVLGLMGGLVATYKSAGSGVDIDDFTFDPKAVGPGPQSLTAVAEQRKTYPPYLSQRDWLYGSAASNAVAQFRRGGMEKSGNKNFPCTGIPEFVDADGVPILYLRARVGGSVGINPRQAGVGPAAMANDLQYNYEQLLPYSTKGSAGSRDFTKKVGNNDVAYTPLDYSNYLKSPNSDPEPTLKSPWQPRGKDAFILISAGSDGFYGTEDDLLYPQ